MAPLHHGQGSFDEDYLDLVLEELIEEPDDCFNCLSSFVAAAEACSPFSTVLSMGGSAIADSCQPVCCSDGNSNYMTNITSVENRGSVNGSSIVDGAMSLGGAEWCE